MNAPIDVTDIQIETERLILRPWRQSDLEDFFEYASVDGVGQMAGWQPHESLEKSQQILDLFISGKETFALELRENGKVIGSLGLEESDRTPADIENLQGREIGYVLSKDYWGKELMSEAVKAVTAYCFDTLHFDFLLCGHYTWNRQSQRVIEKCGFTFRQELPHETRMGTVETVRMYIRYSDALITGPFSAATVHIKTQRLILRPIEESDAQDLYEILSDPETADQSGAKRQESLDDARELLSRYIQYDCVLAVVLKQNDKMVGICTLQARLWEKYPIAPVLVGRELGCELNRSDWGRGLMPEAIQAVRKYCFDTLGYDFISAGHFLRNTRSCHMLQKCGFQFLFEDDFSMHSGRQERIRTYISYNPQKEGRHV